MFVLRRLLDSGGTRWSTRAAAVIGLGGMIGIAAVGLLGSIAGLPLLIAPFGSTCMMIFGAPAVPFAQPRNVIGGHLICTLAGLVAVRTAGDSYWSVAVAVGAAMALMGLTRTFHPPAGGDTVVVILTGPAWWFLLFPILTGCLVLLAVAVVFHNVRRRGSYPAPPSGSIEPAVRAPLPKTLAEN